jgi:UDP-N-acetylglucosamine transferase subunit ALG13
MEFMLARSFDALEFTELVFVTVGNATQGFKRLLNAVDEAAGQGLFGNEPIFIQTGNNPDFHATHCEQQSFLPMSQFEALLRDSSLVISHGGAGTLINILRAGRVPVVMPRRREYSEHVDDHQVELIQALAKEGRVVPVFESGGLKGAVEEARHRNKQPQAQSNSQLVGLVARAIEELSGHKKE